LAATNGTDGTSIRGVDEVVAETLMVPFTVIVGGSETRTRTTVVAFRTVPASDVRDTVKQLLDPRHGEL